MQFRANAEWTVRVSRLRQAARLSTALIISASLPIVLARLLHVNIAAVALILVLWVTGVRTIWDFPGAFFAAFGGACGLVYFFSLQSATPLLKPEQWFLAGLFLVSALAIARLAPHGKEGRLFAGQRQREKDQLHQYVSVLRDADTLETKIPDLVEKIVTIFGAEGVALHVSCSGQIVRAGLRAKVITDQLLKDAASAEKRPAKAGPDISLRPIRNGGEVGGSVGIVGAALSPAILDAIAARIGLALARMAAVERITEAEVARRSEELKSAVLDALAHEIRSPLHSIKVAVTTLLSDSMAAEDRRELLSVIDEEVDRLDRSLDETIQLAEVDATKLVPRKEPQDLAQLIRAAVQDLRASIGSRTVQLEIPKSLPAAECDKGMILQVLKQLLNNALKYSPQGSPLAVSAMLAGGSIMIDVTDRGPGIAEDEQERIFDRHYRGRRVRGRVPGTGLGLASARCMVEAHGGRIWATNAAGGGGAFHISLPASGARRAVGAA